MTQSLFFNKKTIQFLESIPAPTTKLLQKFRNCVHCLFFHRKVSILRTKRIRRQYRLQFQRVKLFTLLLNSYGSTKSMHEISMKIMLCSHNVSLAHMILRSNKNVARCQCILRAFRCERVCPMKKEKEMVINQERTCDLLNGFLLWSDKGSNYLSITLCGHCLTVAASLFYRTYEFMYFRQFERNPFNFQNRKYQNDWNLVQQNETKTTKNQVTHLHGYLISVLRLFGECYVKRDERGKANSKGYIG